MRLSVFVLLVACTGHGNSSPPPLPDICVGRCISSTPVDSIDGCCDSITCWLDEEANEWDWYECFPPPVTCASCTADEICVQQFDSACFATTTCIPRTVDCPSNACSAACEQAYCASPYQCQDRVPCGTESADAFTCYGP